MSAYRYTVMSVTGPSCDLKWWPSVDQDRGLPVKQQPGWWPPWSWAVVGRWLRALCFSFSLSRFPHLEHKISHGTSCTALPLRREPRGHMKQKREVSKEKERS